MYDGEESSSIAQRSDRILSLWMPARSYPRGTIVQMTPKDQLEVKEGQLIIKVVKQRGNLPAGDAYLFNVDFNTGTLTPEDL
jgi:hypothetical protein